MSTIKFVQEGDDWVGFHPNGSRLPLTLNQYRAERAAGHEDSALLFKHLNLGINGVAALRDLAASRLAEEVPAHVDVAIEPAAALWPAPQTADAGENFPNGAARGALWEVADMVWRVVFGFMSDARPLYQYVARYFYENPEHNLACASSRVNVLMIWLEQTLLGPEGAPDYAERLAEFVRTTKSRQAFSQKIERLAVLLEQRMYSGVREGNELYTLLKDAPVEAQRQRGLCYETLVRWFYA